MKTLQSAVNYQSFQQPERLKLPFAKDLATHLLLADYTALIEAARLENAQNNLAFCLMPYDKPVIPENYFKAEWKLNELFTKPCIWCGLSEESGSPNIPNHFWMASYRAFVRPFSSEDIFVMDGDAFGKAREELYRRCFQERRTATDDEIGEVYRAQAETMLAIENYENQYKVPVVIIYRSLLRGELIPLPLPKEFASL